MEMFGANRVKILLSELAALGFAPRKDTVEAIVARAEELYGSKTGYAKRAVLFNADTETTVEISMYDAQDYITVSVDNHHLGKSVDKDYSAVTSIVNRIKRAQATVVERIEVANQKLQAKITLMQPVVEELKEVFGEEATVTMDDEGDVTLSYKSFETEIYQSTVKNHGAVLIVSVSGMARCFDNNKFLDFKTAKQVIDLIY